MIMQLFIHHFETLIKELNYPEIYNISNFGAAIEGVKAIAFEDLKLTPAHPNLSLIPTFKLDLKTFIDEEFCNINNIITILSKGVFLQHY